MSQTYISQQVYNYSSATPVTSDTRTIDIGSRTNGMIGVIVNVVVGQSGGGNVTGITWAGSAINKAVETNAPPYSSDIWYKLSPTDGSNNLVVSFDGAGAITYQIIVFWTDSDNPLELGDFDLYAAGTEDPTSITLTTTVPGSLVISGFVTADNNVPTSGETTIGSLWDQGGNCAGGSYLIAGTAGNYQMDWDRSPNFLSSPFNISGAVFEEIDIGSPPSVALNTADSSTFTTSTPSLDATATDPEADDVRYNYHVSDSPSYLTGVQISDNEESSGDGYLVVHPNPAGGTTWEGHQQLYDRVAQLIQGGGGILDKAAFYFGAHETSPGDTDGYYLIRIYNVDNGWRGDNIPRWQASTAYTAGQKVRQVSTANANQQFLYVCTTGGTSGSSEPTWTEVENDTINDNGIVWTAHRGAGPLNPADPADTPTPGWIAQSDLVAFSPGVSGDAWREASFTGSSRIRLENGVWYVVALDWRPSNSLSTNSLAVQVRTNSTHAGNCYLDGANTSNNGPRVGDDAMVRVYEDYTLLDKVSGTDAGFENVDTPADTDPFNSGDKVRFTVQSGDALADGNYWWKVRATDPAGTNTYGDWTTSRMFTITSATVKTVTDSGAGADGTSSISVSFSLADAGAGSDAFPGMSASVSVLDSGVGSDFIAQLIKESFISVLDTGAGADAVAQILVSALLSDAGAGSDALALSALLGVSDLGSGSDAISILTEAIKTIQDSGIGNDQIAQILTDFLLSDSGVGSDVIGQILVSLLVSDTVVGSDAISVITEAIKTIQDSGSGSETISISVTVGVADSGFGTENLVIAVELTLSDTAAGSDLVSVITEALKTVSDIASASDNVSVSVSPFVVADQASGSDQVNVQVAFTLVDSGAGSDIIAVLQTALILVNDIGQGTDAVGQVSAQVAVNDAGVGVDDIAQIIALLIISDVATSSDIAVAFDSETRIATITFTIKKRSITFLVSNRLVSFALQCRSIGFTFEN